MFIKKVYLGHHSEKSNISEEDHKRDVTKVTLDFSRKITGLGRNSQFRPGTKSIVS